MSILKAEMAGADFNDSRLVSRCVKICERVDGDCEGSFPKIMDDWSELKGLYRFFANGKVTHENILRPHINKTVERCFAQEVVLFVQDTTVFNYSHHPETDGLGPIGSKESFIGMLVHNGYAVSGKDKKPLGLLHQRVIVRKGKVKTGKGRWKESEKWHEGLETSRRLLTGHKKVIQVCDREADIYFFIEKIKECGQGFVIRCAWNRKTVDGHVFEDADKAHLRGHTRLEVARRGGRRGRTVKLAIKSGRTRIYAPKSSGREGPLLEINLVVAEETGSPDRKNNIRWVLLTGEPVDSLEDCLKVVKYYQHRWLVEEFHKGLKSGCRIEERQLQTRQQLEKLLGMFSVLCYALLLMRHEASKGRGGQMILNPIQLKYLKRTFPKEIKGRLTPARALHFVAREGGFIGRKSDGNPGWQTLMRGLYSLMLAEDIYLKLVADSGRV